MKKYILIVAIIIAVVGLGSTKSENLADPPPGGYLIGPETI